MLIASHAGKPARTKLHGYPALLNPGNRYPFIVQDTRYFNAPLIELVNQVHRAKGSAVTLVDVGASVGDSVFLLKRNCPGQVARFLCVEGDPEFCTLLRANMAQFRDVRLIETLLARQPSRIRSLVKHHQGTAASLGNEFLAATNLDSIAEIRDQRVDVVKIDGHNLPAVLSRSPSKLPL